MTLTALSLNRIAFAKINLSLRVLGRRADGYHELDSIVAFASVGDVVSLSTSAQFSLTIDGPFARALDGENLIEKGARAAATAVAGRDWRTGAFRLTKNLPVAAGLGGGSADAAAALDLLRIANPETARHIDWCAIAVRLGADVPVCLESRATRMTGIGDRLTPLRDFPPAAILLANPRIPLSTADVFRALKAPAMITSPGATDAPNLRGFGDLIRHLAASGNDLEPVARRLCPPIDTVLAALARLPRQRLVRMSGSGPTCFALFETLAEATAAQALLAASFPQLWLAAGTLQ